MCEVVKSNFEDIFPLVERSIKNSSFISIDAEFTGLCAGPASRYSLFDTAEDRYQKLKRTVNTFTISQIGICAFVRNNISNEYEAHCYNVYLQPASFGPVDVLYSLQSSSVAFLSRHHFDFNKFAHEGVSFMNETQEQQLNAFLNSDHDNIQLYSDIWSETVNTVCSDVAAWLAANPATVNSDQCDGVKVGDIESTRMSDRDKPRIMNPLKLDTTTLPTNASPAANRYLMHSTIRDRFDNVWTEENELGQVIVTTINPDEREKREAMNDDYWSLFNIKSRLIDELLGFTRIFRVLKKYKKPLVGHNMLLDLLFITDKFHKPLPNRLRDFKLELNEMFPLIYDTKHISTSLRKELQEDYGNFYSTGLQQLYQMFTSNKQKFSLFQPTIHFPVGFDRYTRSEMDHEAGYDSYICGVVFLQLVHICTLKAIPSTQMAPQQFARYLIEVSPFLNHINLIRASLDFISIDGRDPVSRRPQWICIQTRSSQIRLSQAMLSRALTGYGSLDIKIQNSRCAFIAVNGHSGARDIISALKKDPNLIAAWYNIFKHSTYFKATLWGSLAIITAFCGWSLFGDTKSLKLR